MRKCNLILAGRDGQETIAGVISLEGNTLSYTPHNNFMAEVMETDCSRDITAQKTPVEWFYKLPVIFDNAYLRADIQPQILQSIAAPTTSLSQVLKFNQHHDTKGRFSSASGGADNENFIKEGANNYAKEHGLAPIGPRSKVQPDVRATEIASAFQAAPHNPTNPHTAHSYEALSKDINSQWDYATKTMGVKLEPWKGRGQPYKGSSEMRSDVLNNKHLYFLPGGDLPADHPLTKRNGGSGHSDNEKLRAVHDLFGHAMGGFEYDQQGDESAWAAHAQMFSKEALPALTAETKGPDSWAVVNHRVREEAKEKATTLPNRYNDRRVQEPEILGSPNRVINQQLDSAVAQMHSADIATYLDKLSSVEKHFGFREAKHEVGVGVWEGGAEASVVARAKGKVDPDTIRAAAAMMGKAKNQNAMLTWFKDAKGPSTLYEISVPSVGVKEASIRLKQAGVQYATTIPDGHGVKVQLFHTSPAPDEVASISKAIGGVGTKETHGYTEFINKGDYGKIIQDYERNHPTAKAATEGRGTGIHNHAVARPTPTISSMLRDPHGLS